MTDYPEIAARLAHGTDGQNAVRSDRSDKSRCISVHWSVPVQCVLPVGHRENWHEAWHPESGNRLRYQRSMGGYRTEDLHHGGWHDLQIPPPGGSCGLIQFGRPDVRCAEQFGHGWMHRAKVDGVQHQWNTMPAPGLNVDQLTHDVKQLRGMVVAAHARIAELEATSVPDETEYAVRMPGSSGVWPRREFREIGQWERVLADGGVLLERVIRRGPWAEAPNQCPGFEGNPVAPDRCAGCGESSDDHEAVAS